MQSSNNQFPPWDSSWYESQFPQRQQPQPLPQGNLYPSQPQPQSQSQQQQPYGPPPSPNTQWGQNPQWQQPYPSQQLPYINPQAQVPRTGSPVRRSNLFTNPAILSSLISVAIGIFVFIIMINASAHSVTTPMSGPTNTLSTFCSALKSQDYQTAYNQFSGSQTQFSGETVFASIMVFLDKSNGGITDCTVNDYDIHENDATGIANGSFTINYANGNTLFFNASLANERGTWKITTITYS